MAKRRTWDLKAMTDAELRTLVNECTSRERAMRAPYKKGRRGWGDLRRKAETELASRAATVAPRVLGPARAVNFEGVRDGFVACDDRRD